MRPLAHLRAWLGGFFWKQCPVCGRMFGGHEISDGTLSEPGHDRATCRRCPGSWLLKDGHVWRPVVRYINGGEGLSWTLEMSCRADLVWDESGIGETGNV